jgi:alpha-tubulin suppressor-like RCC1 family protein
MIAVGAHHACALRKDGRVACWGDGRYGQLGDGTLEPRVRPVVVPGLRDVQSIVANKDRTCAQRKDGEVRCFGAMSNSKWNAVPLPHGDGPKSATAAMSFQGADLCILDKGAASCTYFRNDAPFTSALRAPGPIEALGRAGSIILARLVDGRLFGWQVDMIYGIPGDGVDLHRTAERLYAGSDLARIDGKDSWISVDYQGDFNSRNAKLKLRPAEDLGEVVFVAPDDSCVVRKGGEVTCQTDAGPYARIDIPPSIEVRTGSGFQCALHEDGGVSCWGETAFGQLGNGIESTSHEAYFVAGLP